VVTGVNYPDALAIGPYAGKNIMPIVFATANTLPDRTAMFINTYHINKAIAIGAVPQSTSIMAGLASTGLSRSSITSIYGSDRYSTALKIATQLYGTNVPGVSVAVGTNFPDALTGAVLSAKQGYPLLLVNPSSGAITGVQDYVRGIAKPPDYRCIIYAYGSTKALPSAVINSIV